MKKIIKHIAILFLLLATIFSNAQGKSNLNTNATTLTAESIFLHTNTSTFTSGETLYYKIYVLNPDTNTVSEISKVAYIELIDANKNVVSSQKVFLKNGTANSDIFIPTSLKTSNYKLIAYTNWMLNQGKTSHATQDIFVINPFEVLSEKNIAKEENKTSQDSVQNLNSSSSSLNKKVYGTREAVLFKPDLKNIEGQYSVSVRKKDLLPLPFQKSATEFASQKNEKGEVNFNPGSSVLPELRGEIISGKIQSPERNNPISDVPVALSIPGEAYVFKTVRTDKNGEFRFVIDKEYSNPHLIIQVFSEKRNEYSINVNPRQSVDFGSMAFSEEFKLKASLAKTIEERATANQIESAYYLKKNDTILKLKEQHFFDSPREYRLDDYTRFPTLKQTITEVISDMFFLKNRGKYSFYMQENLKDRETKESVLTLIDGILVQDPTAIADFNAKDIEKITVAPKSYIYGGSVFGGIASISTKERNFDSKILGESFYETTQNKVPESHKNYFKQIYPSKNSTIPDFRYQLLWLPNLTVKENNLEVSFYTSDVTGTFEISLQGFTNDGHPISIKHYFEVR